MRDDKCQQFQRLLRFSHVRQYTRYTYQMPQHLHDRVYLPREHNGFDQIATCGIIIAQCYERLAQCITCGGP
jgi:hypothetical protein